MRENGSRSLVVRVASGSRGIVGEGFLEADSMKVRSSRFLDDLDLLLLAHVLGSETAHPFTEVRHTTEKELKEERRDTEVRDWCGSRVLETR